MIFVWVAGLLFIKCPSEFTMFRTSVAHGLPNWTCASNVWNMVVSVDIFRLHIAHCFVTLFPVFEWPSNSSPPSRFIELLSWTLGLLDCKFLFLPFQSYVFECLSSSNFSSIAFFFLKPWNIHGSLPSLSTGICSIFFLEFFLFFFGGP